MPSNSHKQTPIHEPKVSTEEKENIRVVQHPAYVFFYARHQTYHAFLFSTHKHTATQYVAILEVTNEDLSRFLRRAHCFHSRSATTHTRVRQHRCRTRSTRYSCENAKRVSCFRITLHASTHVVALAEPAPRVHEASGASSIYISVAFGFRGSVSRRDIE